MPRAWGPARGAAHLAPETRHLFLPSFVFINIPGCTFIFAIQMKELEPKIQNDAPGVGTRAMTGTRPVKSDALILLSFVFIHILGCTCIFATEKIDGRSQGPGIMSFDHAWLHAPHN